MSEEVQPGSILKQNLAEVEEAVSRALMNAGRSGEDLKLVVITKGQQTEIVRAAYELGLRVFGENRIEEGLPKQVELNDLHDIQWHMVGHIQSRKAKDVAPNFSCVHSVDRVKIAKLLNRYREGNQERLPVLLEGNFSGEETKYGWLLADPSAWSEAISEIHQLTELKNLEIIGIMTMAPWQVDQSIIRKTFRKAKEFSDVLQGEISYAPIELSMGMTDDYEIAIQEGATMLRLGRAIFGHS